MKKLFYFFCLCPPFALGAESSYTPFTYKGIEAPRTHDFIKDIDKSSVTLVDGSVWRITSIDEESLSLWKSEDQVSISQSLYPFAPFAFVLTHEDTETSCYADLIKGPAIGGSHTFWIDFIDTTDGFLRLKDGSIWEVSPLDYYTFHSWLENESVIVGKNGNPLSSKEAILINTDTGDFVKAKQLK